MTNPIDEAFRGAAAAIENLVRAIVRDELRTHLGPEADHLLNVKSAPMSAVKLRRLIRAGELRGYKHGRDVFVSASDFRAFVQGRPVAPVARIAAPEPAVTREHDIEDEMRITLGVRPADPAEYRAFQARLAQRRAEGGDRAESLRRVEEEVVRSERDARRRAERAEARRRSKPRSDPEGPGGPRPRKG